jgi:hypothetical protein
MSNLTQLERDYASSEYLAQLEEINYDLLYMCAPAKLVLKYGRDYLVYAIKYNRVDVITRADVTRDIWYLMRNACLNENLEIFRILDEKYVGDREAFIDLAFVSRNLDILQYMHSRRYLTEKHLVHALNADNIPVLDFMLKNCETRNISYMYFVRSMAAYELMLAYGFETSVSVRELVIEREIEKKRKMFS